MAQLGFDVVRLGVIWKGLEPGTDPIDDPAICAPGPPGDVRARAVRARRFDAYMRRLDATVSLLARYGISSLDRHAPGRLQRGLRRRRGARLGGVHRRRHTRSRGWHVAELECQLRRPGCGTGLRPLLGERRGREPAGCVRPGLDEDRRPVAGKSRGSSGTTRSTSPTAPDSPPTRSTRPSTPSSSVFYTGRAHPGLDQNGRRVTCPADDPDEGLIPRIEAADPTHLVAYEGNYGTDSGVPNDIGAMDYPRLVLNFHDYCFLHVPNGPEPPNFVSVCGPLESYVFTQHDEERARDATAEQPGQGRAGCSPSSEPPPTPPTSPGSPLTPTPTSWGGSTGSGSTTTTRPARTRPRCGPRGRPPRRSCRCCPRPTPRRWRGPRPP